MMVSGSTFRYNDFEGIELNRINTQSWETEEDKINCYKKFKTESILPDKMTEPEIRMQNRYWNKLRKDYLQKLDDQQLIDKKMEFIKAKTRSTQLSITKN